MQDGAWGPLDAAAKVASFPGSKMANACLSGRRAYLRNAHALSALPDVFTSFRFDALISGTP
jgi:hypothetical protein